VHIRSAREDDWKNCLELDTSFETEAAWQMEEERKEGEWAVRFREVRLPRRQRISPTRTPEDLLNGWQRCHAFWVAVEQRKVAGYLGVILELDHRQARISDLAVTSELRRHGVASQLLQHGLDWLARQDVEQVVLECQPKAQPAIAFAQARGFLVCGFQDVYWRGPEVGLFFRKRIR